MGHLAGKAPTSPNDQTSMTFTAFPSPSSTNSSLNSPILDYITSGSRRIRGGRDQPRDGLLEATNPVPTEPGDIKAPSVVTPHSNEASQPDMNTIVGGALAPVHSTPPRQPRPKPRPGFRLPSFQLLGIAAPHPDRFGAVGLDRALSNAARQSMQEPLSIPHADSALLAELPPMEIESSGPHISTNSLSQHSSPRVVQSSVYHYGDLPTPPADAAYLKWNSAATVGLAMDSPSADFDSVAMNAEGTPAGPGAAMEGVPPHATEGFAETNDEPPWFEGAFNVLLETLHSSPTPSHSLKILSHALPVPSPEGHIFSSIVSAVQESTNTSPESPMTWINVFHAIPGRFNLADIPRSPPNTPGQAVGDEDYFTEKVFDSAVSIADYQDDLLQLPRSPRSVVPPNSIEISIVERYIPPTNSNEFAQMFEPSGRSILVDRLIELSPSMGSLLFIYPTRSGGETFMSDYLGPVLDPTLRSMGVVHGLSTATSRTLGTMVAVDQLLTYDELERRIVTLCDRLTRGVATSDRFHGRRATFSLSYASRQYVQLGRDIWAREWWTKQEKPRIREAVTKYAREAQLRSSNEHNDRATTSTELLQELVDGVANKTYPPGQAPEAGIEVGVFVIKRSE